MRRFSGGDPTLHRKVSGDAREGCRIIGRVICPAGNSLSGRQFVVDRQDWSRPQANRRGIAGISVVLARVEGLQAELSICRGCTDRECARRPGRRVAYLPALSGPLTFVPAQGTGDKVTCDSLGGSDDPLILRSARKHGVTNGDLLHRYWNPVHVRDIGADGQMVVLRQQRHPVAGSCPLESQETKVTTQMPKTL